MFFILSKVAAFALKPLNWMFLPALLGLFSKKTNRRRKCLLALTIMLLTFTNPWLVNQFAVVWETDKRNPDTIIEPYDTGIVLGGYVNFNAASPPGVLTFHQAGNRLTSALMLYQTGKIRSILLSGGAGRIVGNAPPEAAEARKFLIRCGVPDSVILIENNSRNTRENALYSKQLVERAAPGSRCLLITSAWHTRRAKACFHKTGLICDAFGTDFLTEKSNGNGWNWLEPDWKALMKWELLIKEWVGWLAYRMNGYI